MARKKVRERWAPVSMANTRDAALHHAETVIETMSNLLETIPMGQESAQHLYDSATENITFIETLRTETLCWIDSDLCEVIAQTWEQVPEWTPNQVVPADSGLILFDKPPASPVTGVEGDVRNMDGIGWIAAGENFHVSILTRESPLSDFLAGIDDPLVNIPPSPLYITYTLRLGRESNQGRGVVDPLMLYGGEGHRPAWNTSEKELNDVLSVVGATWLMMGQRNITDAESVVTPKTSVQRKAAARGESVPDVVVTRHRMTRSLAPSGQGRPKGKGAGREATSRWWVRGHWRQQACGPGWSQRKPVFISPHIAGASETKVTDTRPRVRRYGV